MQEMSPARKIVEEVAAAVEEERARYRLEDETTKPRLAEA
jgi:hypothetical protein